MIQSSYLVKFNTEALEVLRKEVLDDLYFFMKVFFEAVYGKKMLIPDVIGRENHFITMCHNTMKAYWGENPYCIEKVPPRSGKTEKNCMAVAWCYAHNPTANNIFASYKKAIATRSTEHIRNIMQHPLYHALFDARLSKSTKAKDEFKTEQGGTTIAVGIDGSGLGYGAGLMDGSPYGGAITIDDIVKAQEASSRTVQNNIQKLYEMTLYPRKNHPTTPIIVSAQAVDENDIFGMLEQGVESEEASDERRPLDTHQQEWKDNALVIPALDGANNSIWPSRFPVDELLKLKELSKYVFASIYQQEPMSAASRMFDIEKVTILTEEPEIIKTFITVDTAETADKFNDASVFSFWGAYKMKYKGQNTDMIGLHSVYCHEVRVEPENLESEFDEFYMSCIQYPVKPESAFIEKASVGTWLVAALKRIPGIHVLPIRRTPKPESISSAKPGVYFPGKKEDRFAKIIPYIHRGQLSIMEEAPHKGKLLAQMKSITHSGDQKHDDIIDTLADAVYVALIDNVVKIGDTKKSVSEGSDRIAAINRARRMVG